jgi:hypothetical protein
MRIGTIVLCVALAGCVASRQEVATRLGEQYVGKNVDSLVVEFGPPSSMFKMNNGQTSYVRQLSAVTDVDTDRGSSTISTRYCKVSVIASPAGIVSDLRTEDSNGTGLISSTGAFGSICGRRLGMKPA